MTNEIFWLLQLMTGDPEWYRPKLTAWFSSPERCTKMLNISSESAQKLLNFVHTQVFLSVDFWRSNKQMFKLWCPGL